MKKTTKSTLLIALVLCMLPFHILFAQRDIEGELKQDMVKIVSDQYTIEEYGFILNFDKEYNVKIMASAPISLLSRDNFMLYCGALSSTLFST